MDASWRTLLLCAAGLFLLFLVIKLRPIARQRSALPADVKAARDRAAAAQSPRERATALCEAATLAAAGRVRWTSAAGLALRAMRADPTWAHAVDRTVGLFEKSRPRLLEKMLWRRLAHLPWDDAHREAACAVATGLVRLYKHRRKDADKALFLARFREIIRERAN
jgi:hypothetical protein